MCKFCGFQTPNSRCGRNGVLRQMLVLRVCAVNEAFAASLAPSSDLKPTSSPAFLALPRGEKGHNQAFYVQS